MYGNNLKDIVENQVPGLFIIIFVFALIEFSILMVCLVYSADQDIVRIYNPNNELVYEDEYNQTYLTEFRNLYGIESFKEEGFVVTRIEKSNEFPTRAWIALSVCVPLVVAMFVVFIVRVFTDLFHTKSAKENETEKSNLIYDFEETRFEKVFSTLGRLNIYSLGCTVVLIVFMYWMVPDLLIYLGKISYKTISELKWILFGIVLFGGVYMVLKAYWSYKTKNEIIRQQAEIQKNRDRLAIEAKVDKKLLEDRPN